uniref:Uncharacterized protein n=1 Tax=Oryza brachyantha TaxID=4533 RepID=J3LD89_ORYBR
MTKLGCFKHTTKDRLMHWRVRFGTKPDGMSDTEATVIHMHMHCILSCIFAVADLIAFTGCSIDCHSLSCLRARTKGSYGCLCPYILADVEERG